MGSTSKYWAVLPLLAVVLTLSGCAGEPAQPAAEPAPEEAVRVSAVRALEGIRRLGRQTPQTPVALSCPQEESAALPASGGEVTEEWKVLLQTVLEEFTYRIDAVEVEEDTAAVTVTLQTKPVGETLVDWMDSLQGDRPRLRALSALPQEERTQALQQELLQAIAAAGKRECAAVLPFTQEAGAWSLTPEGQAALTAALRGE